MNRSNRKVLIYLTPLLVLVVVGLVGWYAVARYQRLHTITFVIPRGTSERLAAGEAVVQFPEELVFNVGDTIVIENQDEAVHAFGPFTVLPDTTLTKRFTSARTYRNSCTFHQNRQMTLTVNSAWWTGWP